jgi:cation transport ATPase
LIDLSNSPNDKDKNNNKDSKDFFKNIKNGLMNEKAVKKSEYIFAIIANLILLYIANNIMNWNLSFILATYNQVLWAVNLAIVSVIVGNILFLFYDPSWFRHLLKIFINIFGLIAVYTFYIIFPLSFSQNLISLGVIFALIVMMIAFTLATAFEVFKLFFEIYQRTRN